MTESIGTACEQHVKDSLTPYTLYITPPTYYTVGTHDIKEKEMDWTPISGKDSLPAEQARILAYNPTESPGYRIVIVTWFPQAGVIGDPHRTYFLDNRLPFTHWRPLPAEPHG